MQRKESFNNNEIDLSLLPEGLKFLTDGYIDYAVEVIVERAIPGIDGLKPANRRVLYSMFENKINNLTKSNTVVGGVMKYHPHGDMAIYETLTRMVDSTLRCNFPTIKGKGAFGKVYSKDEAAASRYTECMLHENAKEFLGEMDGVEYIPSEDNSSYEPLLLPVSFPNILVNPTQGIAVGLASQIPSFNLHEVIDATIEFLKTGKCSTVLVPDYQTGSQYVYNEHELRKLMLTGKGSRLKFRGKVEVSDKTIAITELPYGETADGIIKQINDLNISGVADVRDDIDRNGFGVAVECTSRYRTEEVLMQLYKNTGLQSTVTANIVVIIDDNGKKVPKQLGVWQLIEEWVKFRKKVLDKQYKADLEVLKDKLNSVGVLIQLLEDKVKRDKFIEVLVNEGEANARKYLAGVIEGVTKAIADWIIRLRLSEFGDSSKRKSEYAKIKSQVEKIEYDLDHLPEVIIDQLNDLKRRTPSLTRKTIITHEDYDFSDMEEDNTPKKDYSQCTVLIKDKFIKKVRYCYDTDLEQRGFTVIETSASDTLIGVDTKGRVIRIYLENIPFGSMGDIGTFIPKYLGVPDDSDMVWLDTLKNEHKMFLYNDGKVSFLQTNEWLGVQRQVKVVERGISVDADKIIAVSDIDAYLMIITKQGRISIAHVSQIKQKHRTARTSVFNIPDNDSIASIGVFDQSKGMQVLANMSRYFAPKVSFLQESTDFIGSMEDFITL